MPCDSDSRTSNHPNYSNPIIAEALCEIHFSLPDGVPWKPSLAGELFKKVQNDFPEMEPVTEIGLQLEIGPKRIGHALLPPRQRMRFRHKDQPLLLQLGENVFTVNVLPDYPGWAIMRQTVVAAWAQAREAFQPAGITRLGLRYINKLTLTDRIENLEKWFKATDYFPAVILRSRCPFFSRVECHVDKDNRIIVTLAEAQSNNESIDRQIIFDIDRIRSKSLPVEDSALAAEIDDLHNHIWEIFEAAHTPRLLAHLKGEPC